MPENETNNPGVIDEGQDDISYEAPEQVASTEEEMSDYQEATVTEETSTDDTKQLAGEEPPEKPSEEDPEETPKPEAEKPKEDKPKKDVPIGVQKRINKITREKYDAERERKRVTKENAELRQKLAEAEAGKNLAEIDSKEPNRDDYEEDADFYKDLSTWATGRAIAEEKTKSVPESEAQPEKPGELTREETDTIMDMGTQAYKDFREVVIGAKFMPPSVIREALKSDIPHEIIYEIAQNESIAEKLSELNPIGIANEVRRIEASLSVESPPKPKPKIEKKISSAPKPIKPTTGTHSVQEKDISDLSNKEYRKKRGFTR